MRRVTRPGAAWSCAGLHPGVPAVPDGVRGIPDEGPTRDRPPRIEQLVGMRYLAGVDRGVARSARVGRGHHGRRLAGCRLATCRAASWPAQGSSLNPSLQRNGILMRITVVAAVAALAFGLAGAPPKSVSAATRPSSPGEPDRRAECAGEHRRDIHQRQRNAAKPGTPAVRAEGRRVIQEAEVAPAAPTPWRSSTPQAPRSEVRYRDAFVVHAHQLNQEIAEADLDAVQAELEQV